MVVDANYPTSKVRLFSVYAPSHPEERFFFQNTLAPLLSTEHSNIIAGDFNCIDSTHLDTFNQPDTTLSLVGSTELRDLTSSYGLVDTYRHLRPDGRDYTWYGHCATQASRIDRIYAAPHTVTGIQTEFFPYSDHKALHCTITLTISCTAQGKSYWKMNTSILEDCDYKPR